MTECKHLKDCEFVLDYVAQVKPHWDDFVSLYCCGDFQDVCKRLAWFREHDTKPGSNLMPTGEMVPGILKK